MKRFSGIALVVTLACYLTVFAFAGNGNGMPSRQHFILNVMGYSNCPNSDIIDSSRQMIAVQAGYTYDPSGPDKDTTVKTNTIGLVPGSDFTVTDGNACNKGGAQFILPSDVSTTYRVYVRLVGKPGTAVDVTTCSDEAIDMDGDGISEDILICSTESVVRVRSTGKPAVRNVTSELLTVCLDTSGDGICDGRYNLFDPALEDYFWHWNTHGKRQAQLIFVPVNFFNISAA